MYRRLLKNLRYSPCFRHFSQPFFSNIPNVLSSIISNGMFEGQHNDCNQTDCNWLYHIGMVTHKNTGLILLRFSIVYEAPGATKYYLV